MRLSRSGPPDGAPLLSCIVQVSYRTAEAPAVHDDSTIAIPSVKYAKFVVEHVRAEFVCCVVIATGRKRMNVRGKSR